MKKLSLIVLCILFSAFFFISCGSEDEEEDTVDTGNNSSSDNGEDQNGNNDENQNENNGENGENNQPAETEDDTETNDSEINDNNTETPDSNTEESDTGNEIPDNNETPDNETPDSNETPDADSTYTGDNSNLNTGDESGNQAQTGAVGAACTSDSDCKGSYGSGEIPQTNDCWKASEGFPGGYCSFNADGTDSAACDNTGELFYNFGGSWGGNGLCLHRCTKPSDCRKGYRCSNKIHACLPDCNIEGYECLFGECDTTDGVCLKSGY